MKQTPLNADVLRKLEVIQLESGMTRAAFCRQYFNDAFFLTRVRRVQTSRPITHARAANVLRLAAAGQLTAPRRVNSTEILPRVLQAVAVSGMSQGSFSKRYLGHPWVINRLRRPRLLTAELTARIESACNAVLGPPSPE